MNTLVIKVGGSFLLSQYLEFICQKIILNWSPLKSYILVPGGGKSADIIRELDMYHGLGPQASHYMAILAMEQNAYLLAAKIKNVSLFSTDFTTAKNTPGIYIWLPYHYFLNNPMLPASWDVTSDSIAAHLTKQLKDADLLLLKHLPIFDKKEITVLELQKMDLLDNYFNNISLEASNIFIADPRYNENFLDLNTSIKIN